jgi:arylsulfatase A-like enzyme
MRALPLLLLALCASAGCGGERTRIVLITLDSLRYDSFAGSAERVSSMPRTSALAAKGTRFEHFYASTSSAQPTQATIFTGLHPWNHGVTRNGVVLEEAHRTFPERLRRSGFSTAAVVGSFELHRSFGYAQGFDQFHDQLEIDIEGRHSFHDVPLGDNGFYSLADSVTRTALEVLDGLRGERQFVWVHYFDPHGPYGDAAGLAESLSTPRLLSMVESGHPEIREALREAHRLYERDVASLDEALSRLLQRLLEDAEQVTTHVLVASNHGESFGEAGSIGHDTRRGRLHRARHAPHARADPRSLLRAVAGDRAGPPDRRRRLDRPRVHDPGPGGARAGRPLRTRSRPPARRGTRLRIRHAPDL